MFDLSAFDGDRERGRQIADLRVRGKTEAEVCQMLGVTVSRHSPGARPSRAGKHDSGGAGARYLDAAQMERAQQIFLPLMEALTTRRR